jgi:hypothetical protein
MVLNNKRILISNKLFNKFDKLNTEELSYQADWGELVEIPGYWEPKPLVRFLRCQPLRTMLCRIK